MTLLDNKFIINILPDLHPQTSLINNKRDFSGNPRVVIVHCGHMMRTVPGAVRGARIPSGQREEETEAVSPSSVSTCLTSGAGWPDPFTFKEIIHGTVLLVTPDLVTSTK